MKAIRVQYTVPADFVETNQANIRAVMDELRSKGDVGVKYAAYITGEGRTFVHLVVLRDEEAQSVIPSLAAFQTFRTALKENAETPPAAEDWTVVGTSFEV